MNNIMIPTSFFTGNVKMPRTELFHILLLPFLFFSFIPFFARQNDRHTFTKEKERNEINLSNVALRKDG